MLWCHVECTGVLQQLMAADKVAAVLLQAARAATRSQAEPYQTVHSILRARGGGATKHAALNPSSSSWHSFVQHVAWQQQA